MEDVLSRSRCDNGEKKTESISQMDDLQQKCLFASSDSDEESSFFEIEPGRLYCV